MADNTNKVTIDAAWFAELYGCWRSMHDKTYCDRGICGKIIAERNKTEQAIKERDEALEQLKRFKDMELALATKENYEREIISLTKERDELKAKLAGECKTCVSRDEAKFLGERLAAAERCIDKISVCNFNINTQKTINGAIQDIIRAYREKEAK